ncbi:hypothetical protein BH10BAC2_BH10BAC2_47970 [soil metagenome]
MELTTLKIHPKDNVAVALTVLAKGTALSNGLSGITVLDDIPAKHKFAVTDINEGSEIIMYGVLVGKAIKWIKKGNRLTLDNTQHAAGGFSLKERDTTWHQPAVSKWLHTTFKGYHRADGTVGTANHWLIIPMVFCENKNVDALQEALLKAQGYEKNKSRYEVMAETLVEQYKAGKTADDILGSTIAIEETSQHKTKIFPNVDGIKILNHTLGCAGTKDDTIALCGLLAGYNSS